MADENKVTISQILNEAATFRYSQEYYELYKECAEADLMAIWLEAQDFRDYNKELLAFNEGYLVESTYLIEASEAEQNNTVKGKWKDKVKNVLQKISDIFVRLAKMIITLFEKLLLNDAKLREYGEALNKNEGRAALVEKAEDVKKILAKNYKPSKLWSPCTNNDRINKNFSKFNGTIPNTGVSYQGLLGAAIWTDPYISINDGVNICSLDNFQQFVNATFSKIDASKFIKKIKKFSQDKNIKDQTTKIIFDDGTIRSTIESLKKALKDYQNLKNESKKNENNNSENAEANQPAVEEAEPDPLAGLNIPENDVIADDSYSNLQLTDVKKPVYDRYTLWERQAKNLPMQLPEITPYTEGKLAYLTFDDGPIPEVTPWVLDKLDQFEVKATFFMVGDNVRKHPDIFRMVVERGHGIGNHTMHHIKIFDRNSLRYMDDVRVQEHLVRLKHLESRVVFAVDIRAVKLHPDL